MNRLFRLLTIAIQVLLLGVGVTAAQDVKIDRQAFNGYLEKSDRLTKNMSFRCLIKFETSDHPDGDWQPYSSMVMESVFPDSSYLSYKTGRQGDFVRIGKILYTKEQLNFPWLRTEDDGQKWASLPSSPSSAPGFQGPIVDYTIVRNGESGISIKVVSKPTADAGAKDTLIYIYSFDDMGLLINRESILPNGRHFTRKNESDEYDPNIKIEAPIK